MLPRTQPIQVAAPAPEYSNKPNPFGLAKPRDESEIQARLEQRQKEKKIEMEQAAAKASAPKPEPPQDAWRSADKKIEVKQREFKETRATRDSKETGEPREAREPREEREAREPPSIADKVDNWRSSRPTKTTAKAVFSNQNRADEPAARAFKTTRKPEKTVTNDEIKENNAKNVPTSNKFELAEEVCLRIHV